VMERKKQERLAAIQPFEASELPFGALLTESTGSR